MPAAIAPSTWFTPGTRVLDRVTPNSPPDSRSVIGTRGVHLTGISQNSALPSTRIRRAWPDIEQAACIEKVYLGRLRVLGLMPEAALQDSSRQRRRGHI